MFIVGEARRCVARHLHPPPVNQGAAVVRVTLGDLFQRLDGEPRFLAYLAHHGLGV
jgi:hypothetical protein